MPRIFQDDPEAIPKIEAKIKRQELERSEIKNRIHKGWELSNLGALIRTNKKTLEKLQDRKKRGVTLERKPTFQEKRKNFYYKEIPIEN